MAEAPSQSSVEDVVIQQLGNRMNDIDFASRKAHEASLRRYEAAEWLRKTVGVVVAKDLPAQPSEEDFRLGLRSGIILCNVLNKIQPGAVPKVVEAPSDTIIIPDGAALSAYQYFENVRNFLVAIEEMGIPTFEASDLEQGGKSSRIVNCILALKSYSDWKQCGGNGSWKFSGNSKPQSSGGKHIVRKNSDLFLNFISRNSSEKSLDVLSNEENGYCDLNELGTSQSLHVFVRELLSDKNREDIPLIVEHMLSKVMQEFDRRLAGQTEQVRGNSQDNDVTISYKTGEIEKTTKMIDDKSWSEKEFASKGHSMKHQHFVVQQQRSVQELKSMLHSTKQDMHMMQMKYQEEFINLSEHLNSLANAASGYKKVLEENRKLYNQVQDLKGSIRVYCRIRPFLPGETNYTKTVEVVGENTITIADPSKNGKGMKSFTFNKGFGPSASQEEVFADTQPLIRSVLDGYNVCIFAYGQTGSGKTYTMTGPRELTTESLGVNYRALSDLFQISEQRKDTISYDISVQMIEIYNEQVRDLLVTDGVQKKLEIRNNSSNGINVPNANLVPVKSTTDVINLMNLGHKNRAVGSTAMNDRSSRSHSCLTVHVQGKDLTSGAILHGCMHLVDLAGSERLDKTGASGDRLKEAQHINKSLSALGDVISSLAQKQSHVPYRNSKLTQLLQDSLGGQAKTLMFVHVSPENDAFGETMSTLKFAERVSTVELGTARANKENVQVKELKEQICNLKAALACKDGGEYGAHHSASSSPDRQRIRSSGSSPSHNSSISRRHSLDLQDLLMNSPSWPPLSSNNSSIGSPDLMEEDDALWDGDVRNSPEIFYKKQVHASSKVHPKKSLNNKVNNNSVSRRHSLDNGLATTKYYSDDEVLEADTLEEDDQTKIPKSNSMPSVVESKVRRPVLKPTKSQEMRSQIPQPTRRVSSGIQAPLQKTGRQPIGRRKPATGK